MNYLICIFGKKLESLKSNYLNLLFEYQDFGINTLNVLLNFCYNSFKLKHNYNIDSNTKFSLKFLLSEQQILKKLILIIN